MEHPFTFMIQYLVSAKTISAGFTAVHSLKMGGPVGGKEGTRGRTGGQPVLRIAGCTGRRIGRRAGEWAAGREGGLKCGRAYGRVDG